MRGRERKAVAKEISKEFKIKEYLITIIHNNVRKLEEMMTRNKRKTSITKIKIQNVGR